MSEPTKKTVLNLEISVSLPDSATDEQRERFRRSLEEQGASTAFTVSVGLPHTATPEEQERFSEALKEAFPDLPVLPEIDTKPIDR